MERLEAILVGEVQGVWFRDFARQGARELGLVGEARNLPDGTLQVVAEGSPEQLERFLALLRNGPPLAQVEECAVSWHPPTGEHVSFVIA